MRRYGPRNEIGSLEIGKKADLVMFDFEQVHMTPATDPLGNIVHVGQGRDVAMVSVDGRNVVEDSQADMVDQNQIRREAAEAAQNLRERAKAS